MTIAQDGGKVVSPRHRPSLPPGNTPGTHFYYRLRQAQGHSAMGRIMSMKCCRFLFLQLCSIQMPDHGAVQRSNNSMCKCETSNTKTSYCIRCKCTGCVLSGGLEFQLCSSLTSGPYVVGWWTAHLGRCTAGETALCSDGVGGCLDLKTVLNTLEGRKSLVLARNQTKFPLLASP